MSKRNQPAELTLIKEVRTQTKNVRLLFDGFYHRVQVLLWNDETHSFEFLRGFGGSAIDAEECYLHETFFI